MGETQASQGAARRARTSGSYELLIPQYERRIMSNQAKNQEPRVPSRSPLGDNSPWMRWARAHGWKGSPAPAAMKYWLSSVLLALVCAAPVQASETLTVREASAAARISAEQTLGTLLYRSVGSALVKVTNCRTHGARGHCAVVVRGTQRCHYTAHVLETAAVYQVWGDGLHCGR